MKTILLAFILMVCAGCSDRTTPTVDARITDTNRPLVFLTHPTAPPCSYTNANGECEGTDVEFARKIAARLGRKLISEPVAFEEIIPRLKVGKADFGIATITITEARRRDVDFSNPYAKSGNCFLYRTDGIKPRMSCVSSLRIGAEAGTTGDLYLCRHGCDPVRFTNVADAVKALEQGVVDAIFFDAIPMRAAAKRNPKRLAVLPLETREGYGVAVDKRRPDVLAAANEIIAEGGH